MADPTIVTNVAKAKNPHAVALRRKGDKSGGKARFAAMTDEERTALARKAARARWSKAKKGRTS
jgi:hypothetical protein